MGGTLKGKGVQESWLIKDSFLEHRDGLLPCRELNRHSRMALWMNSTYALKTSQRQKQGEATLKDMETLPARNTDGVRKAKAHLEFKLEKDLEHNRKAFLHWYTGNKREAKENVWR